MAAGKVKRIRHEHGIENARGERIRLRRWRGGESRFISNRLKLVERLHRCLLDVVKDEFERRKRDDVNAIQALLIYNIGDQELSASELRARGY